MENLEMQANQVRLVPFSKQKVVVLAAVAREIQRIALTMMALMVDLGVELVLSCLLLV